MKTTAALLVGMCMTGFSLSAQSQSAASMPHQHGHARLTVIQDGELIRIELTSPGSNLTGFERPPRSPDEREHFDATVEKLTQTEHLLRVMEHECTTVLSDVLSSGYEDSRNGGSAHDHAEHAHSHDHTEHAHSHAHSHDHDHAHHHEDGAHDHQHADFHVVHELECSRVPSPLTVELMLFNSFEGIESLTLESMTDQGQAMRTLTRDAGRLLSL